MSDDGGSVPCMVGKAPCGHYRYACVLDGGCPDSVDLKDWAAMKREGYMLEVKTVQWVRDGGLTLGCECGKKAR